MPSVRYHAGRFPPDERLEWQILIPQIGPAAAALARYDGMVESIPNRQILLTPLTNREAVLSSRIEGTQATMGEVLQYEAGQIPASLERRADIQEVLNYRAAMRQAEDQLAREPLSQRLIRETHRVLMKGLRGQGRSPGEYRRIPNRIGPPGCTEEQARFVPVEANRLPDAMSAWEGHIHKESTDKLVQLAILHAEFEALHPFLDGNGRLGRMLVPLFLWQVELIQEPVFYISAYFEANRESYNDGLLAVSRDDDWTRWCQFILHAIKTQAEENLAKAQGIIDLYNSMKSRVIDLTHSRFAIYALDWIFQRPIFRSADFISQQFSQQSLSKPTARRILDKLCDSGILETLVEGRGSRARLLVFPELLEITEEGKVI